MMERLALQIVRGKGKKASAIRASIVMAIQPRCVWKLGIALCTVPPRQTLFLERHKSRMLSMQHPTLQNQGWSSLVTVIHFARLGVECDGIYI